MLVQYVEKVKNPPSTTGEDKKTPKTWDEVFGQEILARSSAPALAQFLDAEFQIFQTYKMPLEWRMEKHCHNYKGEYGSDFHALPDKSDIFVRRTRERVSTYRAKLMEFFMPLVGKPWAMELDEELPLEKAKDPKSDENEGKIESQKDEAEAHIKRMLKNMNFKKTLLEQSLDLVLHGAMILRAPREKKEKSRHKKILRMRGELFKLKDGRMPEPFIEGVPLERAYWDPQVRSDLQDASGFQIIHHLTAKQLRELAQNDGFDAGQIEAMITCFPNGLYKQTNFEMLMRKPVPMDQRFTVIERWGIVPDHLQRDWAERGLMEGQEFTPTQGYMESWSCGPFVLKLETTPLYEDELPFTMVILERVPTGPEGQGVGDFVADIQAMENAIARALHDNLADSSEPMVELDMTQLDARADLDVYAGKRWQKRPNELAGNNPAVDLKLIPNNSPQLVQAFQLFEGLIPTSTSMPTFVDGPSGGSGMRTIGQQKDWYAQAETFVKLIIMETDVNMWERVITWLYEWLMIYHPDPVPYANLVPTIDGVRGAVKREMISGQFMQMADFMSKSGAGDFIHQPKLLAEVLPHAFGLDDNGIILSPEGKAAKDHAAALQAAQAEAMKQGATEAATHGLKAQTTKADSLLAMAESAGPDNPAWGGLVYAAMGAQGALTPQIILGLQTWANTMAAKLQNLAPSTMAQDLSQVAGMFTTPPDPAEMDPAYRQQGAQQAPGGAPAPQGGITPAPMPPGPVAGGPGLPPGNDAAIPPTV